MICVMLLTWEAKGLPKPLTSGRHWGWSTAWGTSPVPPHKLGREWLPPLWHTASLLEQGWQLSLGYNAIFNTSQRQLLIFFLC